MAEKKLIFWDGCDYQSRCEFSGEWTEEEQNKIMEKEAKIEKIAEEIRIEGKKLGATISAWYGVEYTEDQIARIIAKIDEIMIEETNAFNARIERIKLKNAQKEKEEREKRAKEIEEMELIEYYEVVKAWQYFVPENPEMEYCSSDGGAAHWNTHKKIDTAKGVLEVCCTSYVKTATDELRLQDIDNNWRVKKFNNGEETWNNCKLKKVDRLEQTQKTKADYNVAGKIKKVTEKIAKNGNKYLTLLVKEGEKYEVYTVWKPELFADLQNTHAGTRNFKLKTVEKNGFKQIIEVC